MMANSDDLLKNLDNFTKNVFREKLSHALEQACLIVEADAKRRCPVRDGQLRQSITHDVDEKKLVGIVGTNVEYAPYVEIGTGIYSSKGNGRKTPWVYTDEKTGETVFTHGQKPQPFLQPAMENNKNEIKQCFEGIF